jgi:hypothetical protein
MPAVTRYNSQLTAGQMVIGESAATTQANGLVEVAVDYICRTSDLAKQLEKFYLDAPPPVFPQNAITPRSVRDGKLYMLNHGVRNVYGASIISARFVGVSSKQQQPYRTFEYLSFATNRPVYVSLSLAFGSIDYIQINFPDGTGDNDFKQNYAALVPFSGRIEQTTFTFAVLANEPTAAALPPEPNFFEAVSELEAGPITIRGGYQGKFGQGNTFQIVTGPGLPPGGIPQYTPAPLFSAADVMGQVSDANGLPRNFQLAPEEWAARGVRPQGYFSVNRKTEAVTPSVYIREITFVPRVTSGLG